METSIKNTNRRKGLATEVVSNELAPRWADFVSLYLQNGNAKQSAIQAGFSEEYASVITTRFPDKVRKSLSDALDAKGVTSEKIAEKINWLLDSENPMSVDKGITHAAKIGVGGGYAAEKSITATIDLNKETKDEHTLLLTKEYEDKLRQSLLNESSRTD